MFKSKVLLYSCFSFIGGIFLFPLLSIASSFVFLILGLFLIFFFLSKGIEEKDIEKQTVLILIGFCFLFLSLGTFRCYLSQKGIEESILTKINDSEKTFIIEGIVSKEADTRENKTMLTFNPLKIESEDYSFGSTKGRILITLDRYPEYEYGDRIKAVGKVLSPGEFNEFNYKSYLAKEGIYSLMYFPEVELLEKKNSRNIFSNSYGLILSFKNSLRESIYSNFSPPSSFILGAVLLGDKSRISEKWKEKLNLTGLRHVTAVSGMHVAIILGIIIFLLSYFHFSHNWIFFLSSLLISLFVVITGFQSSALRAGIMAILFLSAVFFGSKIQPFKILVFTAFSLLVFNPLLLKSDVGFQLSFSAIIGILYFLSFFRVKIRKLFVKVPNFLNFKDILSLTLSAQVFTLPILIYNFGYISIISPLSNVLVVPFIPFIMIFGFISGILGIISPFLGWLFSFPAYFLLSYLKLIINFLSSFSFIFLKSNIPLVFLIFYYLFFIYLGLKFKKEKRHYLRY